jgi:hypothetical protein
MLVGLEDAVGGNARYDTIVMVKCPTAGHTNGQFIGPLHQLLMPVGFMWVSGTTTYKTAGGGTNTVFVIEVMSKEDRGPAPPPPPPSAKEARDIRVWQREAARQVAREKARREAPSLRAASLLNYAKKLLERGDAEKARERLQEIAKVYPDTEAAKEAKKLLEEMSK